MRRGTLVILILLVVQGPVTASFRAGFENSAYAYNAENASYWEETRTTLTYFENIFQPYVEFSAAPGVVFTLGAGFLVPFNQEEGISALYPVVRTTLSDPVFRLNLGSLENHHDFPAPILDPLTGFVPRIRVPSRSQVPIDYESFPNGLFSHGRYEYGIQLFWKPSFGEGELYMNWQLPDTTNHRERFDVGLIQHSSNLAIPLYAALHYWHNGGHENPHLVSITENYTGAAGIRSKDFSVLYLASYFLPDRDTKPDLNVFGQALYLDINIALLDVRFNPSIFLSSAIYSDRERYISIEGDPFYRVPLYIGLDIYRTWNISKDVNVELYFVNGLFLPDRKTIFDWKMIRYDQSIRIDIKYLFGEFTQ